jgi:hypothetical protein
MANVLENEEQLKEEIFEDIAFSKAIAEGEETPVVSRSEVFELLEKPN